MNDSIIEVRSREWISGKVSSVCRDTAAIVGETFVFFQSIDYCVLLLQSCLDLSLLWSCDILVVDLAVDI